MHVVAQGGGGKRTPFCRRMVVKAFPAHTHNMQESQDRAVDSVGLMSQVTGSAAFLLYGRKDTTTKDDALPLKIGSTGCSDLVYFLFESLSRFEDRGV